MLKRVVTMKRRVQVARMKAAAGAAVTRLVDAEQRVREDLVAGLSDCQLSPHFNTGDGKSH